MTGHHLSGLFVRSTCRSTGIGRALLTHLKARHPLITLQVYQNNQRALAFTNGRASLPSTRTPSQRQARSI